MNTTAENALCQALFKDSLVASDEGGYEIGTTGYRIEQNDNPVMSTPRIGRPSKPTGRFHWTVTLGGMTPSYRHDEPDDYAEAEVGEAPSLWDAVKLAAMDDAKRRIENVAQGVGLANEAEMFVG